MSDREVAEKLFGKSFRLNNECQEHTKVSVIFPMCPSYDKVFLHHALSQVITWLTADLMLMQHNDPCVLLLRRPPPSRRCPHSGQRSEDWWELFDWRVWSRQEESWQRPHVAVRCVTPLHSHQIAAKLRVSSSAVTKQLLWLLYQMISSRTLPPYADIILNLKQTNITIMNLFP